MIRQRITYITRKSTVQNIPATQLPVRQGSSALEKNCKCGRSVVRSPAVNQPQCERAVPVSKGIIEGRRCQSAQEKWSEAASQPPQGAGGGLGGHHGAIKRPARRPWRPRAAAGGVRRPQRAAAAGPAHAAALGGSSRESALLHADNGLQLPPQRRLPPASEQRAQRAQQGQWRGSARPQHLHA